MINYKPGTVLDILVEHYFLGCYHVFMLHYMHFILIILQAPRPYYYNVLVFNVEYKKIKMQQDQALLIIEDILQI